MSPLPLPLTFLIDSLAVHRATRLITTDKIGEPIRNAAVRTNPDPDAHSLRYIAHCDFCASVYIAAAVAATHAPRLRFARPIVYLLAIADFTAIMADRKESESSSTSWS